MVITCTKTFCDWTHYGQAKNQCFQDLFYPQLLRCLARETVHHGWKADFSRNNKKYMYDMFQNEDGPAHSSG
jgi:hypothetical protein